MASTLPWSLLRSAWRRALSAVRISRRKNAPQGGLSVTLWMTIATLYLAAGLICFPVWVWFRKHFRREVQLAAWKRFDDTHHWSAAAEDWIHNDNRREVGFQ
jgi:hypothetical protein